MGEYVDLLGSLHSQTKRDYAGRLNDPKFTKIYASKIAREYGKDYWDGDRRINYGGYRYIPGRFSEVAQRFKNRYSLHSGMKILDIGCGKGFQLIDLKKMIPNIEVWGIDISRYAIENSHDDVRNTLIEGSAESLPFADNSFDFVYSINTLHNLTNPALERALREISRVCKTDDSYICVESFRNIEEFVNLLSWQVTCEQFCSPEEWLWWFEKTGYFGDYSFIYFE